MLSGVLFSNLKMQLTVILSIALCATLQPVLGLTVPGKRTWKIYIWNFNTMSLTRADSRRTGFRMDF
jgi:hypothetical protein